MNRIIKYCAYDLEKLHSFRIKKRLLLILASKNGSPVNSCVYPYIIDSL